MYPLVLHTACVRQFYAPEECLSPLGGVNRVTNVCEDFLGFNYTKPPRRPTNPWSAHTPRVYLT